jgi:aquaporin Z
MRITGKSYLAELLGTFFFVLSIFASGGNPLIIGGSLALVVYLISKISGGMVNPSVALSMFLKGTLNMHEFLMYIVAQFVGGAGAYYAYNMVKA